MGQQFLRTERKNSVQQPTLATTNPTGRPIDYRGFAAGSLFLGAGIQASTWTWHGAYALKDDSGAAITPLPIYDSAGNAVTQSIGGGSRIYPIPVACAGVAYLFIVSDQDNGESVYAMLKS